MFIIFFLNSNIMNVNCIFSFFTGKSDTQYLEKLSPYERDLMKRKLIIAPDGKLWPLTSV
jgi:hypothetical protein